MKYGYGIHDHTPEGDPAFGVPAASGEWLVSFLLLCMVDGSTRGDDLDEKIRRIGFHDARPGEVYRTLQRMEDKGLVSSTREEPGALSGRPGLPWRTYEITEPGEAYLEFRAGLLVDQRKITDLFVDAYSRRSLGRDLV